ncbi:hypothetical protein YC2023_026028 [Brassica napus]
MVISYHELDHILGLWLHASLSSSTVGRWTLESSVISLSSYPLSTNKESVSAEQDVRASQTFEESYQDFTLGDPKKQWRINGGPKKANGVSPDTP